MSETSIMRGLFAPFRVDIAGVLTSRGNVRCPTLIWAFGLVCRALEPPRMEEMTSKPLVGARSAVIRIPVPDVVQDLPLVVMEAAVRPAAEVAWIHITAGALSTTEL